MATDVLELLWFSAAERSWLKPDAALGRLGLFRLGLFETPSPFELVIMILPFELGVAESSIESN